MDIEHLRALLSGERQEPMVIGALHTTAHSRAIGANTHAVLLSRETIVKQETRHPDIGFDDYRLIPYAIRFGLVLHEATRPRHLMFVFDDPWGRRDRVMVRSTTNGNEIFVTSCHRTKQRQTKALLARGRSLRRHA